MGENARFAPVEQATRKGGHRPGNLRFPSLFRGVRRGFPSGKPGRQRSAKLVWRSRMPNPGKISPEGAV